MSVTNKRAEWKNCSLRIVPKDAHTVPRGAAPKDTVKVTVKNPKGSVEKLSPEESPEDAHTVLRGAAPKDSVGIRGPS